MAFSTKDARWLYASEMRDKLNCVSYKMPGKSLNSTGAAQVRCPTLDDYDRMSGRQELSFDRMFQGVDVQGVTDEEWLASGDLTVSDQVAKAQPIGICRYCRLFEYIPGTLPPFGECHHLLHSADEAKKASGHWSDVHHWVYPYSCCRDHVRSDFDMVRDHKKFTWNKDGQGQAPGCKQ